MTQIWGVSILSTVILLGVIDDIRSRKYHNALFLFSLAVITVARFVADGGSGLLTGTTTFMATMLVGIPLWKFRIMGAGDVKLYSVIGMGTALAPMGYIFAYSLIWGAMLSLVTLAIRRQLVPTLVGWMQFRLESTVKTPYTVAIFLGWAQWLLTGGGAV